MHQSTPENRRALSRTLDRWRREKGWSQSDLARAVFGTTPNPKNGNPIAAGRDNVSKWLSGTRWPDLHIHDLRRTWATLAARRGVALWQIAGVLGDTVEAVGAHYAHHAPDHLRGAVG